MIDLETLDERLLKIHRLWANPPSQLIDVDMGKAVRLTASSCFTVPALPLYHKRRFRDEYDLQPDDIAWWFSSEERFPSFIMLDMLFERSQGVRLYPTMTSKIIVQLFTNKFESREAMFEFFADSDLTDFGQFIKECVQYEYSWRYIQDTVNRYFTEKLPWTELTLKYPYTVNSNVSELETLCDTILKDNPKSVEDYRKGKTNSINHLKGVAMKMTKGKADIKVVTEILERKLKE